MASRHMKRCSVSLVTREIQVKTTMSYHFTPVIMVIIKKSTNINAGEGVERREPPILLVGMEINEAIMENSVEIKSKNKIYHMKQQSHYWTYTLRKPQFQKTHISQYSLQHYLQ